MGDVDSLYTARLQTVALLGYLTRDPVGPGLSLDDLLKTLTKRTEAINQSLTQAEGLRTEDDGFSRVLLMSIEYHLGQSDIATEPYILHVLRVALRQSCPWRRQVGLLHDVLEDCEVAPETLLDRGVDPRVVRSVESLTHWPGEDYLRSYIPRVLADPWAPEVKLADLDDILDITRLPHLEGEAWIERTRERFLARRLVQAHIDSRLPNHPEEP